MSEGGSGGVKGHGGYLGSDLGGLLGVHHADVLKVLEGVLAVLLLGAHVLLQQAEHVAGLPWQRRAGRTGRTRLMLSVKADGRLRLR